MRRNPWLYSNIDLSKSGWDGLISMSYRNLNYMKLLRTISSTKSASSYGICIGWILSSFHCSPKETWVSLSFENYWKGSDHDIEIHDSCVNRILWFLPNELLAFVKSLAVDE
jgi:hypothetical protein